MLIGDPLAGGGLRAKARHPGGATFAMPVDTGSSFVYVSRGGGTAGLVQRTFELIDELPAPQSAEPVRASFRGIDALTVNLPGGLDPLPVGGVLGGSLLRNFTVALTFYGANPTMTLWSRQGASDGFLATAGYAVLQLELTGGAELTAFGRPDLVGLTAPVQIPPTRVVVRACGGPQEYLHAPEEPRQLCCQRGDEVAVATGADLALLVSTGVGPVVLARSAWDRVVSRMTMKGQPAPPEPVAGPPLLLPTLAEAIAGTLWSALPRLALVDQEAGSSTNPGPCVELARSRRLEWVERHAAESACAQPCDMDPQEPGKAQNTAAYVDLGGGIPVAVVPDGAPFLQALRAEIRPEGPEIDGLLGAAALARTAMEIDYRSQPARAVFACERSTDPALPALCWASPRCPRLFAPEERRSCFGLPIQSLPAACSPTGC